MERSCAKNSSETPIDQLQVSSPGEVVGLLSGR